VLCHGYSLADIDKLTMIAVLKDFWHRGMDINDRRELAWSAIVECLYEHEDAPSRHDLIQAAQSAISEQARTNRSTHGISSQNEYGEMPNFWRTAGHYVRPEGADNVEIPSAHDQARSLELAALPGALTWARHYTTATLEEWSLPADVVETTELLVSELATNAVVHSQAEGLMSSCPHVARTETGRFWLRLQRSQARLLVEVQDTGMSPPVLQHATMRAESGHGLMLIEALSSKWGYYYAGGYKIVWFEMRLAAPLSRLRRAWPPLATGLPGRRARTTPARHRTRPSGQAQQAVNGSDM
jgi:anti-sigma regulatory factor (Ser/Thr protein kinase)